MSNEELTKQLKERRLERQKLQLSFYGNLQLDLDKMTFTVKDWKTGKRYTL